MFLAGILGSFEQDFVFLLLALVLFGRRLPDVANTLGRKMYQLRRGMDEMKNEITKPIREQIEAPIRDAAEAARRAAAEAEADVRATAEKAKSDMRSSVDLARSSLTTETQDSARAPNGVARDAKNTDATITDAGIGDESADAPRDPFPYPRAPRTPNV